MDANLERPKIMCALCGYAADTDCGRPRCPSGKGKGFNESMPHQIFRNRPESVCVFCGYVHDTDDGRFPDCEGEGLMLVPYLMFVAVERSKDMLRKLQAKLASRKARRACKHLSATVERETDRLIGAAERYVFTLRDSSTGAQMTVHGYPSEADAAYIAGRIIDGR